MSPNDNFWNQFAASREPEWTRALSRLLQFDTVSGDPDPEALRGWRERIGQGFDYLDTLAKGLGLETRRYGNRVLVIDAPGPKGAPVLGFPIHLDVVPAGEGWTYPPFGGVVDKDAIWGRGTQDDKGPIIEAIYALAGAREQARAKGRDQTKTVRIMVFSEEECGVWDDIPYYFQFEKPPDFSIVPDANFPITVGEKGILNLKLDFEWTPPLDGTFTIISGERPNVVPAKARMSISSNLLADLSNSGQLGEEFIDAPKKPKIELNGALQAEFYGVGAHGSLPHKGYSAARDALILAAGLPVFRRHPAGRVLAWLAQAAGDLKGKFLGIDHSHPKVGFTTVNMGVLRVDEKSAAAILNIRTPIGLTLAETTSRVAAAAEKLGDASSGITKHDVTADADGREPIYVEPEKFTDWIDPMREAYTAVTGRKTELQSIGGTTFAKAFPNAVCFGPVDENEEEELAHQADEHVTLRALRRNIEIYGRTISGIAFQ